MSETADRYLDALLCGDRNAAAGVVDVALGAGACLRTLYLDVLQPSMREIGRLWQENVITVADEHLATAITQSVMGRLFEKVYEWRPRRSPSLIAACADEERHQMGLRMLCDLLELEGWDTTYLGASVPVESLVDMVARLHPEVVALSASISPHIPRVRAAIAAIRAADLTVQPFVIVGGRALFADTTLAARIGADLMATDAAEAVDLLQRRFERQS
jgi:methanogenic corrinoid protein MtbC1